MRLAAIDLAGERGGETVFSGVNFVVTAGSALVVTGANGSGKSTLLRIIAGLLPASAGQIDYRGDDTFPESGTAIHYLGHQNAMKTALTVEENLRFWQSQMGKPHLNIPEALDTVGLAEVRRLPFGYLSTGQKRRISIARLLVSFRPIWLLDEPTAGLDKASGEQFTELMKAQTDLGGIIIAATHIPLGIEAQGLEMGEA